MTIRWLSVETTSAQLKWRLTFRYREFICDCQTGRRVLIHILSELLLSISFMVDTELGSDQTEFRHSL